MGDVARPGEETRRLAPAPATDARHDAAPSPFAQAHEDVGLVGFRCPDGGCVRFEECLSKCRMAERCAPMPILVKLGKTWHRRNLAEPSTTELIAPTRISFLKRTESYFESPGSRKWALLGSAVSAVLEEGSGLEGLSEETIKDEINKGTFDYYDGSTKTLYDWKLVGAWKAASIVVQTRWDPTDEFFKSGPRKGQRKTVKVTTEDATSAAARVWDKAPDWCWQLSDYGLKLRRIGFPVERLALFLIVRDSDGYARQLGLHHPWYEVEVPALDDAQVESYFRQKRAALADALSTGTVPPICGFDERWQGRRCDGFCPVREACDRFDGVRLREETTPTAREREEAGE